MYDATLAETVQFAGANGDMLEAYAARPLDSAPRGGVVVIVFDDGRLVNHRASAPPRADIIIAHPRRPATSSS